MTAKRLAAAGVFLAASSCAAVQRPPADSIAPQSIVGETTHWDTVENPRGSGRHEKADRKTTFFADPALDLSVTKLAGAACDDVNVVFVGDHTYFNGQACGIRLDNKTLATESLCWLAGTAFAPYRNSDVTDLNVDGCRIIVTRPPGYERLAHDWKMER